MSDDPPNRAEVERLLAEIKPILDSKIAEGRPLKKVDPEFSYEELLLESPRGCLLSSAAFLDDILENRIRQRLTELSAASTKDLDFLLKNRPMPPLGSFGVRITVARVLGIIGDDIRRALAAVQNIRNSKAHSWQGFRFTLKDVRSITTHFSTEDQRLIKSTSDLIELYIQSQQGPLAGLLARPSNEQIQFIFAVTHLISEISPVDSGS